MKMQWCSKKNQSCSGMLKYKQMYFPPPPPPLQPSVWNFSFENRFCVQSKETFVLSGRILSRVYLVHFFFFSFTELKGGRKRRPSENTRNVFYYLLQPWWLKGFLSVCSNKYFFLLVFGTALLRGSSNGWLLVFHSGIRKWQYITSS